MTREAIYQQIVGIIKDFQGADFAVSADLMVQESFADSVELMEFVITLEETFDIEISDQVTDQFKTLSDVVTYIVERKMI